MLLQGLGPRLNTCPVAPWCDLGSCSRTVVVIKLRRSSAFSNLKLFVKFPNTGATARHPRQTRTWDSNTTYGQAGSHCRHRTWSRKPPGRLVSSVVMIRRHKKKSQKSQCQGGWPRLADGTSQGKVNWLQTGAATACLSLSLPPGQCSDSDLSQVTVARSGLELPDHYHCVAMSR